MEEGYDAGMKVRIGISHTDKLIELDIDDAKAFKKEIERAVAEGGLGWFTDIKGRSVGVPSKNLAFVELEDAQEPARVGFAPAV